MLMMKRQLQEKLFDTDPRWLGPKYLKEFSREANWIALSWDGNPIEEIWPFTENLGLKPVLTSASSATLH